MLILQRKIGESIQVGDNITIHLSNIDHGRNKASIGIEAPSDVRIMRTELLDQEPKERGMTGDPNRLLDNGLTVVIFRNRMDSYTAFVVRVDHEDIAVAMNDADEDGLLTDDFTPDKALRRLADKVAGVGDYANDK